MIRAQRQVQRTHPYHLQHFSSLASAIGTDVGSWITCIVTKLRMNNNESGSAKWPAMTKAGVLTLPWIFEFAVFSNNKADVDACRRSCRNVPLLAMALVSDVQKVPKPCSIMRAESSDVRGLTMLVIPIACACQGAGWRDRESWKTIPGTCK